MGGLFGGKKKSSDSSSSSTKTTTADSIETGDGTVYDRRGTTPPVPTPSTSPVATLDAPAQSMGTTAAPATATAETKPDTLETVLPSKQPRMRKRGTLAGQAGYGFG